MKTELENKAMKAAARYIELKGCEVLKVEAEGIDLIFEDDDALVFCQVTVTEYGKSGFKSAPMSREQMEVAAATYLAEFGTTERPLRFDEIAMIIIAPDRAMLRHHINLFG